MTTTPATTCDHCGTTTPYDISQGWLEQAGRRYCSWTCQTQAGK